MFVNHLDRLFVNAAKSKQVDGFEDLVMHSNALYFVNKNADGEKWLRQTYFGGIINEKHKQKHKEEGT